MDVENAQSQMRKGILEFCTLSVIAKGEAYPTEIIEVLKQANLRILEGTLYPLLTRLKNAEMVSYRWVESSSGPPRKYFSLTPRGREFLDALAATWNELASAVDTVVNAPIRLSAPVAPSADVSAAPAVATAPTEEA